MKRTGYLKRNTPLARGKRVKPFNAARRAKAYARNFGDRGGPVREMGCLVAGKGDHVCVGEVQAAHARARGMGGCGGDRRSLVPLCAGAHHEAGERGTSQRAAFELSFGVSLESEAQRIALELDARGLP